MRRLGLLLVLLSATAAPAREPAAPGSMRVCVFHEGSAALRNDGRLHAILLKNLLGHFREVSVRLVETADYRGGGLAACDRAAYVGSVFDTALSDAFLRDVGAYRRPFLWLNYGIWQLERRLGPEAFERKAGFTYLSLRAADPAPPGRIPDFFRFVDYKGQRFTKVAALRADGSLIAAPELAQIKVSSARVLARAVHSGTGETSPYAAEKDGFFYIADNPFQFINPRDRYLVLADLLFDFLRLPPRGGGHALVRLEDVHPDYDLGLLYKTIDLLKARRVPFAISLIPKFVPAGEPESAGIDLSQRPDFLKALRYAEENGGELLLHGYTHDTATTPECASLGSGDGYEFWDRCRQAPLAQDSRGFAHGRVVSAKRLLLKAGLSAVAWVTPHYAASPDDYAVFGRHFERVVQRVCVYLAGRGPSEPPVYITQFFPYTIYKDHYGQFVWPENLGFVSMPETDWGYDAPGDIAAAVPGMSVVRDSWASFYWHPQLMARPGEDKRLEKIIDAVRAGGYEFVALKSLKARRE